MIAPGYVGQMRLGRSHSRHRHGAHAKAGSNKASCAVPSTRKLLGRRLTLDAATRQSLCQEGWSRHGQCFGVCNPQAGDATILMRPPQWGILGSVSWAQHLGPGILAPVSWARYLEPVILGPLSWGDRCPGRRAATRLAPIDACPERGLCIRPRRRDRQKTTHSRLMRYRRACRQVASMPSPV
jgi:hypothetical protein